VDLEKALMELPESPPQMNWFKVILPFFVFFVLVLAGRIWPHSLPVVGLPMMFVAAAIVTYFLSPVRLNIFHTARDTVHQLLPLIGTLTCVGILVQIMTLTGVRGLIAITVVTLPILIVFGSLFLVLPVSEAVLMWGAAPVLGVPLVLLFNTIGLNPIVALAGMSVIWPLGDALPPTAIIGRLTKDTVGMEKSYGHMLKHCLIPASTRRASPGAAIIVFLSRIDVLANIGALYFNRNSRRRKGNNTRM
jgi:CitMHS family citrate-Mg2+:H+ or citrate-Ca2+:H+ symporter